MGEQRKGPGRAKGLWLILQSFSLRCIMTFLNFSSAQPRQKALDPGWAYSFPDALLRSPGPETTEDRLLRQKIRDSCRSNSYCHGAAGHCRSGEGKSISAALFGSRIIHILSLRAWSLSLHPDLSIVYITHLIFTTTLQDRYQYTKRLRHRNIKQLS